VTALQPYLDAVNANALQGQKEKVGEENLLLLSGPSDKEHAVGSVTICGRFPNYICKTACALFIELLRQICESCCYNGSYEDKCWEKFSFWKDDFHDRNPACPHPNDMQ
jgi:hypothetical protein